MSSIQLSPGARMVANRLRKNLRRLKGWRRRGDVTCFRAYDADLPEYAAAVDCYEEAQPPGRLFLHVQEYQAPRSIPEEVASARLDELQHAVAAVFEVEPQHLAVKTRRRGKGGSKYGRFAARGEFFVVREGAVRLEVNLFDYLDTGLFLDHRPVRLRIGRESRGKRFLNLFCYTGAATAHAAAGGASATTSVDLSATYLQWAQRNLALNGVAPNGVAAKRVAPNGVAPTGVAAKRVAPKRVAPKRVAPKGGASGAVHSAHRLVQADVMRWLAGHGEQYDLIFCDPPTFSNSKRADDFDVQQEHVRLLELAVARLAPGGLLLFSNNFRRFSLDAPALERFAAVREITPHTIDPDFERNTRIHRCWELRRPEDAE